MYRKGCVLFDECHSVVYRHLLSMYRKGDANHMYCVVNFQTV